MAYIGNIPAEKYSAFQKQDFTTSATTSYVLDNPVANANELALFINNVRQEPTTAYSASGTTLTLTEATSSSDDMYAIFLGKAIQTVTPANNSVTGDMLSKPFNYDSGTLYLDDTNNRVGILDTSPSFPLEVNGTIKAVGTNNLPGLVIDANSTDEGDIAVVDGQNLTFGHHTLDGNTGSFTERMRIDDSGNLLIGTTSVPNSSEANNSLCVAPTLANSSQTLMQMENNLNTTATSKSYIDIYNGNGTQVGSISANQSATQYNTSSDYRLKENVSYDFDATTRLKQLKPARFNFIADANTTVDGFLAHEVSEIVPEAISGEKDAVKEDGTPEYQGIDQSKLVPLLVKTIQELEARITELENN